MTMVFRQISFYSDIFGK